jgi:hypothetical protein
MTTISEELGGPQATIAGPALDLDLYFQQMSPRTQMLKSFWDAHKAAVDELPGLCDIELMNIYEIAPYIALVDLAAKDEDFKNRYWGGELTWRFAFEDPRLSAAMLWSEAHRGLSQRHANTTTAMAKGHAGARPLQRLLPGRGASFTGARQRSGWRPACSVDL